MKKIALFLMMALSYMTAHATNGKSLFVTFNDGQKVEFALTTEPEVSFGDDLMTIKTSQATASYELWKVTTFTYGATTTSISQVKTSNKFNLEGNRIIIDGTNNKINVFDLAGKAVQLTPITTGDKTIIYLDELTQGVYLININNKSIKIARQ